jgi:proteic killer suppression protein
MQVHFRNIYLERLYRGLPVSGKPGYDKNVMKIFKMRIRLLESLENTAELKQFHGLNFEALRGNKKGICSIRIDKKYRLEFVVEKSKITLLEIIFIEDLSNHYK